MAVVAALTSEVAGFHRVRVAAARTRLCVFVRTNSDLFSQNGVQSLPDSGSNPRSERVVHGLPGGEMFGTGTPLAAGSEDIKNGIQDGSPSPFGSWGLVSGWEFRREEIPFALGTMVWVGSHGNLSLPTGPQNLVQDEFTALFMLVENQSYSQA